MSAPDRIEHGEIDSAIYVREDLYDALAERADALRNTLTDALDYIVTLRETIETIHKLYPTLTVAICGTTLDEEAARRLAAPSAPKEQQ